MSQRPEVHRAWVLFCPPPAEDGVDRMSFPGGLAKVPAPLLPEQICFDSKPRIISKGTKDSPSVCSNLAAKHSFYNNK